MQINHPKLLKQRLFAIHSNVGIFLSLLFYISLFFGILGIFLPYIQVWEKPSRHFENIQSQQIYYDSILNSMISNPDYPKNNIYIEIPGFKNEPALKVSHIFVKPTYFNPNTQETINDENKQSHLASFLNEMHFGKPLLLIGKLIFGFMAIGVMFLIIGGLLLVFYLKFKNNGHTQQGTFSKWHRKILIFSSFPLLLITLAGSVMNIGYKGASQMTYITTKGQETNIFKVTNSVLFSKEKIIKPLNIPTKMLKINTLLKKAKNINPQIKFQKIQFINWNDKNAQIEFSGFNPYRPFLNGIYNKPKIILNAIDGAVIKDVRVEDRRWGVLLSDALYFLHLLYDVDIITRFFVAFLMFLACCAIGFGVMLWLEKKAKIFNEKATFYHGIGKFFLAAMIGVIPATATLFIFQWLLPFDLEHRVLIQQIIFYNSWLATLVWSFYRINSYTAAKEFLCLGGFLFIFSSIVHFIVAGFTPLELYEKNMLSILSVDISLILSGSLFILVSKILPKNRTEAKIFWNKI